VNVHIAHLKRKEQDDKYTLNQSNQGKRLVIKRCHVPWCRRRQGAKRPRSQRV